MVLAALRERIGRLSLGRVPAPYVAWVIACWVLTAAFVVLAVVPGGTEGIVAEQAGSSAFIGIFDAPLGLRLLLAVGGAVLAGTRVISLLLRDRLRSEPGGGFAREARLALAVGFPAIALAADRVWVPALAAFVLFGLAEVAAHRRGVATRGGTVLAGLVAASTWVVLAVSQLRPDAGGGSWTWIALFGFAAAFGAYGAYYGVARAAESRSLLFRPLFRDDLPLYAVAGVVLAAVVVTVLRLTIGRDLFPAPDPELWAPAAETAISWLHAALVAGIILAVAARSVVRPLHRTAARRVTAGLALVGNADLILAVGVLILALGIAAITGAAFLPEVPVVVIAALKVAGVVVLTAAALLPRFRGTTGRALALVTGAYLVPVTVHGLLRAADALPPDLVGFPASPVQVALPLLAAAVAAVLVPPLRRAWGTGLVVRLAVVPLLAVHAGWLLPVAWSGIGRVLLVVGVVMALLFLLPKLSKDPDRHALDVLGASGGQLLGLTVLILAVPSFVDDPAIVVLGLFWLSVAVIAGLIVRTQPGSDDVPEEPKEPAADGAAPAADPVPKEASASR